MDISTGLHNPNNVRVTSWLRQRWLDICALSAVIVTLVVALHFDRAAARINVADKKSASRFTTIGSLGSLSGWNARDGKEWALSSIGVAVVFNVAPRGQNGDQEFWDRVVSHVKELKASVQFVGLCSTEVICDEPRFAQSPIVYLTAMDPLQMATLSLAATRDVALLYQVVPLANPRSNPPVTADYRIIQGYPAFSGVLVHEIKITTENPAFVGQLQDLIGEIDGADQ